MGQIKFKVHPLFFAFGLFYALKGELFLFFVYTLTAVMHELGHSIVSGNLGYRLNKITLMPFGAVASGDIEGLKIIDQLKIAMAGPLVNLSVALLFVAVWWIFPNCYPYTETAVYANLSMAIINLIPAYPLDGGRALYSILATFINKEKAHIICKATGIALGFSLLALFIVSIFSQINISVLFFALFIIFGAFSNQKENKYVSVFTSLNKQSLLRGMPYKKTAVDQDVTLKKLITLISPEYVNEIVVFSGDRAVASIGQTRLLEIISQGNLYSKIKQYI